MQLYTPLQRRLSAYCRVVAGGEGKASDLIQETLAAAFQSFDRLRDTGSFQFFLFGIARNCHLKQQRRWKFIGKQSDIRPVHIEITSESMEMQYDIELIRQCISKLNTEQHEVVLMFHIMGFSIHDISLDLNISEAAVKNRLARGRDNLRKLLSDKESQLSHRISAHHINSTSK